VTASIAETLGRARAAQAVFERADQATADAAASAAAWAILHPERNQLLARQAVADTGMGNVADKAAKNRRKTLGLLRDLRDVRSVGVIAEDPERGITEIARPAGVVAAITPATNPAATPANNIINALKGRNAIVLAPSPKASATCALLLGFVHAELAKVGLPRDLVQQLPPPGSKAQTAELMAAADLVVATGSRENVRGAYRSGKPALGVGAGNVAAIVMPGADFGLAARRIATSKIFDHATSCSSENSVVAIGRAWGPLLDALFGEGGVLLDPEERARLERAMFPDGNLARGVAGRCAAEIAAFAGLERPALQSARFLLVEESGCGSAYPFSGEKLSPVLALYRAADFDAAMERVRQIYDYQGKGHSVGVHGATADEALRLGLELPVCRVIVDQVHCVAVGGSFDNGLPFSLSMGCGTWGGNGFSDNLNYRHFLNITRIVRPVPASVPTEEELLGDYWRRYGR
jgi:sulfoacetaldehyde dehydrogenase